MVLVVVAVARNQGADLAVPAVRNSDGEAWVAHPDEARDADQGSGWGQDEDQIWAEAHDRGQHQGQDGVPGRMGYRRSASARLQRRTE